MTAVARVRPGLRILLADDSSVIRITIRGYLRAAGAAATEACDGGEAVDHVCATPYDVVLMDCQMPVLDGMQATSLIRDREPFNDGRSRLTIIALTANDADGDRDLCRAAGMDDFLSKPVVQEQLLAVLAKWFPTNPDD